MRELVGKTATALHKNQGVTQKNPKKPEISIIKHFTPNSVTRRAATGLPQVRCCSESPENTKYSALHPVFKFVDNFLNSVSANQQKLQGRRPNTGNCKRPLKQGTPGGTLNTINYKKCNTPARLSPVRKPNMPSGKCIRQENNAKGNANNMNKKSTIRIPCQPNKIVFLDEVFNLKKELTANNCKPTDINKNYVHNLKQELNATKTKHVDEKQNEINELQNEITNFRLRAKTKYSSSCSNLGIDDKTTPLIPPECKKIGESPSLCANINYKSPTSTPLCETIWQSKMSLPSSTDVAIVTLQHEINFENKLKEANFLIEKVKDTLRDMGLGASPNVTTSKLLSPIEKKKSSQCTSTKPSKNVIKTSSKSKAVRTRTPHRPSPGRQSPGRPSTGRQSPCPVIKAEDEIKPQDIIKKVQEIEKIITDRRMNETEVSNVPCSASKKRILDSAIKESSPNFKHGFESGADDSFTVPVARMERANSPIKLTMVTSAGQNIHDTTTFTKFYTKTSKKCGCNSSQKLANSTEPSTGNIQTLFKRKCNPSTSSESRFGYTSSKKSMEEPKEKVRNLCVQKMPQINIRRGLTMQKTLHLNIKPSGSTDNDIGLKSSNIKYEEVNTDGDNESELRLKCSQTFETNKNLSEFLPNESCFSMERVKSKGLSVPMGLSQDALILFKSFQIFDDYDQNRNSTQKDLSSLRDLTTRNDSKRFIESFGIKLTRTPWELGLYKTIGTQCSNEDVSSTKLNSINKDTKKVFIESKLDIDDEPVKEPPQKEDDFIYISATKSDDSRELSQESSPRPSSQESTSKTLITKDPYLRPSASSSKESCISKRQMSSSSTSSESSYLVHGSIDGFVMEKVDLASPANQTVVVPVDLKREKTAEISENHSKKQDCVVQTSLASSSEEDEDDDDDVQDPLVTDFVQALTGTSDDVITILRNSPSYAKKMGSSSGKAQPETDQSALDSGNTSDKSFVQAEIGIKEKHKNSLEMEKIKLLEKPNESVSKKKDKNNEQIVLRVQEERFKFGEGDDHFQATRLRRPFYRRVLGKFIEPHSKRLMYKTQSIPNASEESISEGEISGKTSRSIGEISSFNFYTENKKNGNKRGLTEIEKKSGAYPKTVEIDRINYNNWVSSYLQKSCHLAQINDSSLSSPLSSFKK